MRQSLFAYAAAASMTLSPAFADPQADADYIVDQTVTQEIFEGALVALRPVIISALQNDLRAQGITLPDPDRFFDLFVAEFIVEFTKSMRGQTAAVYLELFSPEELDGLAKFYRSDSGQAMIAATPELTLRGAQMGEMAGQLAGQNAARRLADRIENEGLMKIDDPGLMDRLLNALR